LADGLDLSDVPDADINPIESKIIILIEVVN
jgi:hypothetical protein